MIINIISNPGNLPPDEVSGILELRANHDCVWIDAAALKSFDPHLHLEDTSENFKRHPLRLVLINLKDIDFSLKVFSDKFRRNTMVLASDDDVLKNELIAQELEALGIALLMTGTNANPISSVLKSLTSLKFKSILIEGGDYSRKLFNSYS